MSADPRISTLATDVARFCTEAEQLVPAQRLRLVAQLRDALEAVAGQALDVAMSGAKSDGWGLRSVGATVGLSHERVRYRLAQACVPDGTGR
ncbi:hypothetical protein ACFWWC_41290 [Streptomyces sp. NPDC058642]|uniref:hypothetical protein n=1 Tax=Streptomyces sp. NPDC058642 TaxID=3346572 RepID=UPI00365B7B32